ncbi:hypothetical protein [Streptomyces sp. NPDC012888]|uniref:hypothetical protein n=1 Tax=Streptomyces sp. NPDC012888 TaxID=3364855 RepID=UPI00368EE027
MTDQPRMEAVHYGIPVAYLGHEGAMLALGHHDPKRVLAAFDAHTRRDGETVAGYADYLTPRWAVFRDPAPEYDGCMWTADWCDPDAPGAQPVTLLDL